MIDTTQLANLTIKDVAKYFIVSIPTINRWRRDHGFPSCLIGQTRRLIWADILKWLAEHKEVIENEKPMRGKEESLKLYEGAK